jgi:hypothetical protein
MDDHKENAVDKDVTESFPIPDKDYGGWISQQQPNKMSGKTALSLTQVSCMIPGVHPAS